MLALPVNQADDDVLAEINAPPKMAPTPRPEPVSYRTAEDGEEAAGNARPSAGPRRDDAHVSAAAHGQEDADKWVPLSSTWKPSPHTWKPLAQSWQQPRATPPAQETPPRREEVAEAPPSPLPPPPRPAAVEVPPVPTVTAKAEAKPAARPSAPSAAPPQAAGEPPLPGWLMALVWFNVAFDVLLLPWGLPGRWLRRDGGGRSVLGLLGVLLLAASVALGALEWFGWTWDVFLARIP